MPKELTAFRMASELMAAMRDVKKREGIPIAVQMDFAIRAWLTKKGVTLTTPKRATAGQKK